MQQVLCAVQCGASVAVGRHRGGATGRRCARVLAGEVTVGVSVCAGLWGVGLHMGGRGSPDTPTPPHPRPK